MGDLSTRPAIMLSDPSCRAWNVKGCIAPGEFPYSYSSKIERDRNRPRRSAMFEGAPRRRNTDPLLHMCPRNSKTEDKAKESRKAELNPATKNAPISPAPKLPTPNSSQSQTSAMKVARTIASASHSKHLHQGPGIRHQDMIPGTNRRRWGERWRGENTIGCR